MNELRKQYTSLPLLESLLALSRSLLIGSPYRLLSAAGTLRQMVFRAFSRTSARTWHMWSEKNGRLRDKQSLNKSCHLPRCVRAITCLSWLKATHLPTSLALLSPKAGRRGSRDKVTRKETLKLIGLHSTGTTGRLSRAGAFAAGRERLAKQLSWSDFFLNLVPKWSQPSPWRI